MQSITQKVLILATLPVLALASCSSSTRADLKAPRLSSLSPTADSVDIATNAEVRVTFDQEIRASSIHENTFFVRDLSTADLVDGTRDYDAQTKTATFRPTSPLAINRRYEVVVEGSVESKRFGITLRDGRQTWRFTTSPVASSRIDTASAARQMQILTELFDIQAELEWGQDALQVAPPEDLFDLALELAQQFMLTQGDPASPDLTVIIAMTLIGEDAAQEIMDTNHDLGAAIELSDWSNFTPSWASVRQSDTSERL